MNQDDYTPAQPGNLARPPKKKHHIVRNVFLTIVGGFVLLIVIIVSATAGSSHTPTPTPSATGAPPAAAAAKAAPKPAQDKVTFVVTGSDADVTYGQGGSEYQGHSPMSVTWKANPNDTYSIDATLNGSGSVAVKIEVNGKEISSGTATGEYQDASAAISQSFGGHWEDLN